MTGKVARLKNPHGFGFIKPDGGGADRFFHRSGMADGFAFEQLTEGMRVSFEHEDGEGDKGPRAVQVQPIS